MTLRDDLPMALMGAEYIPEKQEVRFLFFYPTEENMEDWKKGLGAVLLCSDPQVWVPGDQDKPEYQLSLSELRDYTDKLTGERGIPCGIGMSKNEVQIVDYDGPEWQFKILTRSIAYSGMVELSTI